MLYSLGFKVEGLGFETSVSSPVHRRGETSDIDFQKGTLTLRNPHRPSSWEVHLGRH